MNRNMEKRVWQRVYGGQAYPPSHAPRQKQALRQALARAQANVRFYEQERRDPVYGEAFAHLAQQTQEHCKMLRQMLNG